MYNHIKSYKLLKFLLFMFAIILIVGCNKNSIKGGKTVLKLLDGISILKMEGLKVRKTTRASQLVQVWFLLKEEHLQKVMYKIM